MGKKDLEDNIEKDNLSKERAAKLNNIQNIVNRIKDIEKSPQFKSLSEDKIKELKNIKGELIDLQDSENQELDKKTADEINTLCSNHTNKISSIYSELIELEKKSEN